MKLKYFLIPVWGVLMLALVSTAVMLLWNWLMPSVFGLCLITYWQALGLFLLARILFGGFGCGHMMAGKMHRKRHRYMHEKWMKMSSEQRKEFIDKRMSFGLCRPFGGDDIFGGNCGGKSHVDGPGKREE